MSAFVFTIGWVALICGLVFGHWLVVLWGAGAMSIAYLISEWMNCDGRRNN